MPLYEFRCPDGHHFEKFYRSISAAPAEEGCPECGASAPRVISSGGLVFKGSGFYITDYGKDGKKAEREAAAATKSGETKPDSSAGGDPKSDSSRGGDAKAGESAKPEPKAAEGPSPKSAKPGADAPAAPASTKAVPAKKSE